MEVVRIGTLFFGLFKIFSRGIMTLEHFFPSCCIRDIPEYIRLYLNILEFFVITWTIHNKLNLGLHKPLVLFLFH